MKWLQLELHFDVTFIKVWKFQWIYEATLMKLLNLSESFNEAIATLIKLW